jgi:hypothetical protein
MFREKFRYTGDYSLKKDNSPLWVLSLQFPKKREKERMVHPKFGKRYSGETDINGSSHPKH